MSLGGAVEKSSLMPFSWQYCCHVVFHSSSEVKPRRTSRSKNWRSFQSMLLRTGLGDPSGPVTAVVSEAEDGFASELLAPIEAPVVRGFGSRAFAGTGASKPRTCGVDVGAGKATGEPSRRVAGTAWNDMTLRCCWPSVAACSRLWLACCESKVCLAVR